MPRTVENIGFYARLGFSPAHLTVTLTNDIATRGHAAPSLLSQRKGGAGDEAVAAARRLAHQLAAGYDFTREILLTAELGLGDASLVDGDAGLNGGVLWHSASLAEGQPKDEGRIGELAARGPPGAAPAATRPPPIQTRNSQSPIRNPTTAGLLIFALTYLLIAVQRLPFVHLNRPAASLVGAVAMVVFGVLPLPEAYAAVDFDVLVFLLGMMLIVGYLEVGKFFEWAAEWGLRRAGTSERLRLGGVVGGGLLSAFFVNDTICLVVTPVLLAALGPLRVRPNPYLIGLAMGANVGSVVSVTGNPQNMLVGIWSGASFGGFLVHMLPVGVGGVAITYAYLRWAHRAELREPFHRRLRTVAVTLDPTLITKGLAMFGVAVAAWLARGSLPLVAISAGALMVLIAPRDPPHAIGRVDLGLLLFFSSLFVVMR